MLSYGFFQTVEDAVAPQISDYIRYVSTNGNDSNEGLSWRSAKLTVPAAVSSLSGSPGIIYVAPGTYTNSSTISITADGTRLVCSGRTLTILNYTGSRAAISYAIATSHVWDSSGSIEDCGIAGTSSASDAIYVTDATGLRISGNKETGFTNGTAIHLDNTGSSGIDYTERTLVEDNEITNCLNWFRFTVSGSDNSFAYTRFIDARGEFNVANGVGFSFENNADVEQGYFLVNGNINASGTIFYKLTGTAIVGNGNWFAHHSELDMGGSYTLVNAASGTTFQPSGFFSAINSPTLTGLGLRFSRSIGELWKHAAERRRRRIRGRTSALLERRPVSFRDRIQFRAHDGSHERNGVVHHSSRHWNG